MASDMRKAPTPAEAVVWEVLRGGRLLGLRFRRQHVVEGKIVDFYCHEHRLCIELDGAPHLKPMQKEKDLMRDQMLAIKGYRILRMMNDDVLADIREFRLKILEALRLSPRDPPL
jgi:very-short-patch-repair endonuclease